MDKLESIIQKYAETARSYRDDLSVHLESQVTFAQIEKSSFSSLSDYLDFKNDSLSRLIRSVDGLISSLEKYNKYKTLNRRILKGAMDNSLINGKFYDYAISNYIYRDVEPEIYELIDRYFNVFYKLSEEIREINALQH